MPEPTKPLSPRPSRGLCLGSALLAIVISTLVHLLSPPPQPAPSPRFSVIIDAGSTDTQAHLFSLGPDGRPDLARSAVMRVSPGLSSFTADTARAAELLRPLMEFAKEKVGSEGAAAATEVRLMATVGLRLLEESVREAILVSCRNALRASGFRFEDSWAKLMFVSDEVLPLELSTNFTFGETTYTLYSNNFLNFGQVSYLIHRILTSTDQCFITICAIEGSSKNGTLVDPCAPKGYSRKRKVMARTSGASRSNLENQYHLYYIFVSTCIPLTFVLNAQKCEHRQCHLGSNFVPELLGHFLATENFYFTSKFFGLDRSSSLSDFVVAGEQLCNKDLSTLKQKYLNHSDEDFSWYCFSSAYIVALLHDSLGVPLDDKRQAYHTRTPSFFLS
ncbi:Nucleoside-diphosphatase mig-23 [Hordeum vulgare]|nr:Nucleoside-diphosphatase mig-23 [Hordeum vulgare]